MIQLLNVQEMFESHVKFHGLDTEEAYKKNLSVQSSIWPWRDADVNYYLNSQGYRCPEWSHCRWDQSILIFGCSFMFGPGVDQTQTVASQLQEKLSIPVINLGALGQSVMFQWINTVILREADIRPVAVVYVWPEENRFLEFKNAEGTAIRAWGSWSDNLAGIARQWVGHPYQGLCMLRHTISCVNSLWKCPVLHYKVGVNLDPTIKLSPLLALGDHARDDSHPGPTTYGHWASIISQDLKLK